MFVMYIEPASLAACYAQRDASQVNPFRNRGRSTSTKISKTEEERKLNKEGEGERKVVNEEKAVGCVLDKYSIRQGNSAHSSLSIK